jgi:hypothetical protein
MAPEDGKFELEQPATIAAASIKQPAIEIFEIFTPFIASSPSSAAQSHSSLRSLQGGRLTECCL